MFNLCFMANPFQVIDLVVFLYMIYVDDKVVSCARLFEEVLRNQSVEVIVLAICFAADGDTRIALGESGPKNVTVFNFIPEAHDASAIGDSIPFGGYTFLKFKFLPALSGQRLDGC